MPLYCTVHYQALGIEIVTDHTATNVSLGSFWGVRGHKWCRAVNSQTRQILKSDRDGMIDGVITLVTFLMTSYCLLHKKKVHHHTSQAKVKKCVNDVIGIATFDLIGLCQTNHMSIIAQITISQYTCKNSLSEFMRKINIQIFVIIKWNVKKLTQETQIIWNFIVVKVDS